MDIGDTMQFTLIDKGKESIPSPDGKYMQEVYYDIYHDANLVNGPRFVLFSHEMFLQFVEEVAGARRLRGILQPIERPNMQFATGANEDALSGGTA